MGKGQAFVRQGDQLGAAASDPVVTKERPHDKKDICANITWR